MLNIAKLEELLMPYLKDRKKASEIAKALSDKGVVVVKPNGIITCNFESDQVFGKLSMNGEEIDVYLGSYTLHPIGIGRDPMTCQMTKPVRFKRSFTIIER